MGGTVIPAKIKSVDAYAGRSLASAPVAPGEAQSNPYYQDTPGVYLYGVPAGAEWLIFEVIGAGGGGGVSASKGGNGGYGSSCGASLSAKLQGDSVSSKNVLTVTIPTPGVGGSMGVVGATLVQLDATHKLSVRSGYLSRSAPADVSVTWPGDLSIVASKNGLTKIAGTALVGGTGATTPGGLFASAGGVGGNLNVAGKNGTLGGGGGGGGPYDGSTVPNGGDGGKGAVRITAYGADGQPL